MTDIPFADLPDQSPQAVFSGFRTHQNSELLAGLALRYQEVITHGIVLEITSLQSWLHFLCHPTIGQAPVSTPKIVLSPEEHAELSRRVRSAIISQRDGRRARVILLAAQGCTRVEIARLTGFSLPVITCWCKRFQAQRLEGLLDEPGRGRKPSLPLEAVRRVLPLIEN